MWKEEVIKLLQGEDLEEHLHVGVVYLTLDGKESAYKAGDLGSIPGLGRSPGEGNGNLLQYSCLENSMDRGAWWVQSMGPQRVRHN